MHIVTTIWKAQKGKYFFLSTKSPSGKWEDHVFRRSEFKNVPRFLKEYESRNIYFCPHGFKRPERKRSAAVMPNLLWSDLDDVNPRELEYEPTILIESSPGRYVGLWMLDGPSDDKLNRRMSFACGGDVTGWDLTQVLRVPGTKNYKYATTPRVRTLTIEGPQYRVKTLLRKLPEPPENDARDDSEASSIVQDNWKKLSWTLRRELMSTKPVKEGHRSEMMFKLACELVECGIDEDAGYSMLAGSRWNKYAGRGDEARQLKQLWARAINKKTSRRAIIGEADSDEKEVDSGLQWKAEPVSETDEAEIDWIWYRFLARGIVTSLQGDPEAGKSFISQFIAKSICNGEKLPAFNDWYKENGVLTGRVLYFDLENPVATVTKKRLRWMDISPGGEKRFYQCPEPINIIDDEHYEKVLEWCEEIKPTLIVFDTLATYIGGVDMNTSNEMQVAFRRFPALAERYNASVLVLRHLTKARTKHALFAGQGSAAITGMVRIEITAGKHPEDRDLRMIARSKGNLTAPPPALEYFIESAPTDDERDRAKFSWGQWNYDIHANDLIGEEKPEDKSTLKDAREWLKSLLDVGEAVDSAKVHEQAEARSISERTLARVCADLGVEVIVRGWGKTRKTLWKLTKQKATK